VTFTTALAAEYHRRRTANPRYSLRAFASALRISHSALSRLGRGDQHASDATIASIGRRLNWPSARILSMMREQRFRRVARVADSPAFVPDARWIASRANLSLDDVQLTLHDALRTGRLDMTARDSWKVTL